MRSDLKVFAITSLPTVGNAGLKNMMGILGNCIIPIPTLISCGLGNMKGNRKITYPFEETLKVSFELAKENKQKLIVYTGYLIDKHQIDVIVRYINLYKEIIETVIVDPVCGDNNNAYVDKSIIDNFYKLLKVADIITPNETEFRLLVKNGFQLSLQELIEVFQKKFALQSIIVTSFLEKEATFNIAIKNNKISKFLYENLAVSYSGTGDLFVALFIKFHFFNLNTFSLAITKATQSIGVLIQQNIALKTEPFNLLTKPLIH